MQIIRIVEFSDSIQEFQYFVKKQDEKKTVHL